MKPTDQKWINKYYSVLPLWVHDLVMHSGETPEFRKRLIDELNINEGDKVIEIASGTGLNFIHYPEGIELYAIDNNNHMLSKAKKRAKKLGLDIEVILTGATETDFPDNYFDAAVMTYALSAIPENKKALDEAHRIVKDGGKIGIIDFDTMRKPIFGHAELYLRRLVNSREKINTGVYIPNPYSFFSEMQYRYILKV